MNIAIITGFIRHLLTSVGGGLVANGAISGDELSASAGAIATIVGVVWSWFDKKKRS